MYDLLAGPFLNLSAIAAGLALMALAVVPARLAFRAARAAPRPFQLLFELGGASVLAAAVVFGLALSLWGLVGAPGRNPAVLDIDRYTGELHAR